MRFSTDDNFLFVAVVITRSILGHNVAKAVH